VPWLLSRDVTQSTGGHLAGAMMDRRCPCGTTLRLQTDSPTRFDRY